MQKYFMVSVFLMFGILFSGCSGQQSVIWNASSEKEDLWTVKVYQEWLLFSSDSNIRISIDGNTVIRGNCASDQVVEYISEYKGKKVTAKMIYKTSTKEKHIQVFIAETFIGEFVI